VLVPRAVRERGPIPLIRTLRRLPLTAPKVFMPASGTANPAQAGQKPWTISHDEAARVHRAVWRSVGCVANARERAAAGDAGNRVSLMPHRRICSQQVDKEPAAVGLTQNFEDTPPHCEGCLMRHLT